ncbi:MAG: chaperone modulator CbpM [Verrucomicrobiota bacterium]
MPTRYTIVQYTEGTSGEARLFDLKTAAELTGVHPEMILEFTRAQLVPSAQSGENPDSFRFDERAIYRLRQIESLRQRHHTNLRVIRYITQLLDRLDETEQELHLLREQLR